MTTDIVMVRTGNVNDIARLARLLRGTANTLVLSAGGARGFAHLGVIRALREPRVPIDLIGGCSMGSIVGAAVLAKAWAVQRRGCVKSLGPGNFCAVTAPE